MQTLILDFDGTIADTRMSIIRTIQITLHELHLALVDDMEIQKRIGLPLVDTFIEVAKITDKTLLDKAISIYREKYDVVSSETVTLFPHVRSVLQKLHKQGVCIAVASSKGKDSLLALLEKLEIKTFINIIVGEQDVEHKKPAPDMVLHILKGTQSTAENTLVAGDTIFDIAMGQAAMCKTCGVTYGNHSREVLQQQKPDYIIDDFSELLRNCFNL